MAAVRKLVHELVVYRIPFTVGNRELRQYFTQFGPVMSCKIHFNKTTGFHTDFGWVTFVNKDSVTKVLNQEHHTLDGYKITIHLNDRREKAPIRSEDDV
ncbi:SRA stem-loop-interacting RNA-binding protein, mitochondrial [Lithobates pipiens]